MKKSNTQFAYRNRQVQVSTPATSSACFKAAGALALFGLVLAIVESAR